MRATFLFLLLPCLVCLPAACAPDHCAGDDYIASSTAAGQGAALDAWSHTTCTRDEDDACTAGIPRENALELCQHDARVVTTDGGSFFALHCHYYSTAKECHSTPDDDEH